MTTVPEQFITDRPSGVMDYLHTAISVLPRLGGAKVASPPELGDMAPCALGPIDFGAAGASQGTGTPTLVAFVRHCGCPFAEKEVRLLGEQSQRNGRLRVVIVQHSSEADTRAWFDRVGGLRLFPDQSRVVLVSDVKRDLYAAWGIGQLGWRDLVNGDIMRTLHRNKVREGLDITKSDWTSYRWQNSGGFAVDSEGKIRWRKIARDSSDVCNYEEAAAALAKDCA